MLIPSRGLTQGNLTIVPDGAGGAFLATDDKGYEGVVMLHHLGQDGSPAAGWPLGMTALQRPTYGRSGGSQGEFLPALLADGSGSVFVARTYRDRLYDSIAMTRLTASGQILAGWDPGINASASRVPWECPSQLCADGQGGIYVAVQENLIPPRILLTRFDGQGNRILAGTGVSTAPQAQFALGLVSDGGTGAIVVWEDHRNGVFDQVFVQHMQSDGSVAPGWPASGLAVCSRPTSPGRPSDFIFPGSLSSITEDGSGGAYIAWTDLRDSAATGGADIYAQHIRGDGSIAVGWSMDGIAVCLAPGHQRMPVLAGDGHGGVLLAWQDARNGQDDIYAQHLNGSGSAATNWPEDGQAVCRSSGDQRTPHIISDGASGAIIAWVDGRGPRAQIYASHLTYAAPAGVESPAPAAFALAQPLPNPTSGAATVTFSLPDAAAARLEVFDLVGRRVEATDVGSLGAGRHVARLLAGGNFAPGVYLVRLSRGKHSLARRVLVTR